IHGEEKYLNSKSYLIKKINFSNHFKRALNDCKKVIFVSDYIKNRYKYLYDIIIDENRVKVIHSGVNNSLFKKIVKAKNNDNNSFLTVSRIEKAKGFDVMLHSLCKVKESGLNFHWYIAGDGSYFEKFKENVSNSTLNKNITFLGRVERSCLPEIYSLADYYISLSELNESYGLSYLEAASCGVKPIGYNRCGTAEAFKYIHNGVLIESFKDINEISETL
ncbi:glycosyltransferase family 4 protein, partial [Providencia rettgeri]|nr:glycosyltransferase family 4 protein [Providencia rettgeri]